MGRRKLCSSTEVLYRIKWCIRHSNMPPTCEELRKWLGVGSTRTVLRYLRELEDKKLIRRWPGARGIAVI